MKPLTVRPGLVTPIGLRTLVPRYAKVPATATRTIANTVASLLPYETQPSYGGGGELAASIAYSCFDMWKYVESEQDVPAILWKAIFAHGGVLSSSRRRGT
jgi:hypothetical protein